MSTRDERDRAREAVLEATASDPRLDAGYLEVCREVADLLRRFQRPRFYAGDYEADFAERILERLGKHGRTPPGRAAAASPGGEAAAR